jgi:hypothetical protein
MGYFDVFGPKFSKIEPIPLSLEFYGGASYKVSDPKEFFFKLKIMSPTAILRPKMGYF